MHRCKVIECILPTFLDFCVLVSKEILLTDKYQIFRSNTNNTQTVVWFQVSISKTNPLYKMEWFQGIALDYNHLFENNDMISSN